MMTSNKPINKHATKEACNLLQYLYATAEHSIISGQHTQTVPMEEYTYIYEQTGRHPKLVEFELLAYSPNINYEDADEACLTEVEEAKHTMETALKWASTTPDGILSLCFHWFSPIGGRDKSFYSKNTDFDPEQVLIEGTPERAAFYHDLEVIAQLLKPFQTANIPILWRPLHESEGTWFWWGSKGPAVAAELYKLVYHYLTDEKQLNNLLWVWSCPAKDGYPGDDYVDVIGWDIYLAPHTVTDYQAQYEELMANTHSNKVAALTEVGVIPDITLLEQSKTPWAYYMTWSKEFCLSEEHNTNEALKKLYCSDYCISL